jgi:hypothetical protein
VYPKKIAARLFGQGETHLTLERGAKAKHDDNKRAAEATRRIIVASKQATNYNSNRQQVRIIEMANGKELTRFLPPRPRGVVVSPCAISVTTTHNDYLAISVETDVVSCFRQLQIVVTYADLNPSTQLE